jgi:exodeoxyribonuclease VII large subunit
MNQPATNLIDYTVSELAFALKRTVEGNFERVRVRGEISGFKGTAGSGHCYFTLKDAGACLDAVIWRTTLQRLRFKPREGLEMVATGKLTTFPSRSRYQIVVDMLEPAGAGALMALLEERRKKLAAEGLFDAARKKPLPYLPRLIGVITSPTGAVIRDILHRLRDRFPSHVLVWPVRVQGDGAAEEVAAAVRGFNTIPEGGPVRRPDLLIVARGGGSIEDLWAFNEEIAVRAVAASRIPIIAAVGHETDWTLIDHAADLRAPTPTGAAEMAVPVRVELFAATRELATRHDLSHRRGMEARRREFSALARALPSLDDLFALRRQKLDEVAGRLSRSLVTEVAKKRSSYAVSGNRLSPILLERSIVQRRERLGVFGGRIAVAETATLRAARRALQPVATRHDLGWVARIVMRRRERFEQLSRLLHSYSYEAVLERGFALVVGPTGEAVRSPSQVRTADPLTIRLKARSALSSPGRACRSRDGRCRAVAHTPTKERCCSDGKETDRSPAGDLPRLAGGDREGSMGRSNLPCARQNIRDGEARRRTSLSLVQGAGGKPGGAGRRRPRALLCATPCRPQGMGRRSA